jgi:hypothetical protein
MSLITLLSAIIDFFIYRHSPISTFLAGPWSVDTYDVDCIADSGFSQNNERMYCNQLLSYAVAAMVLGKNTVGPRFSSRDGHGGNVTANNRVGTQNVRLLAHTYEKRGRLILRYTHIFRIIMIVMPINCNTVSLPFLPIGCWITERILRCAIRFKFTLLPSYDNVVPYLLFLQTFCCIRINLYLNDFSVSSRIIKRLCYFFRINTQQARLSEQFSAVLTFSPNNSCSSPLCVTS